MTNNKRKHIRIAIHSRSTLRKEKSFILYVANIKDVSESGIRFLLRQYFPVGSSLDVEVRLEGYSVAVKGKMKVIWIKRHDDPRHPFEAGMEFIEIFSVDLDLLRKYILHCSDHERHDAHRAV